MKAVGILLLIGAAIFGVITLSEFSRYQELVADGNPFAGLVSNSYIYCSGIAMTALLCGIGFLLVPSKAKEVQRAAAAAGGTPYAGMAWDGKHWVAPTPQYPPTPTLPHAAPPIPGMVRCPLCGRSYNSAKSAQCPGCQGRSPESKILAAATAGAEEDMADCPSCGRPYNRTKLAACPKCQSVAT